MVTNRDASILIESIDPITSEVVESANSIVTIVDGIGEPSPFSAKYPWGSPFSLTSVHLKGLERSSHYQIYFAGTEIPAAVSLEVTHADGSAFVANPTSKIKNIHWTDNEATAKVIIMPTTPSGFSSLSDLKFYVCGVDDVAVSSFQAFDQNGTEIFTFSANPPTKH